MIKIGWGWKVPILYSSFALMLLVFFIMAMGKGAQLVRPDYYEAESEYGDVQRKTANSRSLTEPVEIRFLAREQHIRIQFPQGFAAPQGEVRLFRLSDADMDQTRPVNTDKSNVQHISSREIARGLWQVQVDWQSGGVEYFDRQSTMVQ